VAPEVAKHGLVAPEVFPTLRALNVAPAAASMLFWIAASFNIAFLRTEQRIVFTLYNLFLINRYVRFRCVLSVADLFIFFVTCILINGELFSIDDGVFLSSKGRSSNAGADELVVDMAQHEATARSPDWIWTQKLVRNLSSDGQPVLAGEHSLEHHQDADDTEQQLTHVKDEDQQDGVKV
jgi:hypothetical protein